MHRIIRIKAYEAEHGPHFNDEHARKAVSKMENEDGTRLTHFVKKITNWLQLLLSKLKQLISFLS